ncbi:MAG: hypothetical protein C0605_07815 [Hyphomicrobiales bacterium]|nr:MAG: hypothetical protein C0605_07815 [Hyphomicrobiales bacterium]
MDGGFVAEAFSDALRVHVGRGKPWSVEALAAATALDFATVKGYHAGANGPSLAKFLTIAAVLPDEFINRVLALAGFGGAARLEPDAVSALTVNRQISDLMAQFAAALEDGRIDHRERAELVASARALLPMIQDFVATHGGEK